MSYELNTNLYKQILDATTKFKNRVPTVPHPEIIQESLFRYEDLVKNNDKELLKMLLSAYSDEWLAVYQYSVESDTVYKMLSDNKINTKVYGQVTKELDIHTKEEMVHAKMLVPYIIKLDGMPIKNIDGLSKAANGKFLEPNENEKNPIALLKQAVSSEAGAIKVYSEILTFMDDNETSLHSNAVLRYKSKFLDDIKFILDQEKEHKADLEKVLRTL